MPYTPNNRRDSGSQSRPSGRSNGYTSSPSARHNESSSYGSSSSSNSGYRSNSGSGGYSSGYGSSDSGSSRSFGRSGGGRGGYGGGGRGGSGGGRGGRFGKSSKFLDPAVYVKPATHAAAPTEAEESNKAKFSDYELLPIIQDSLAKRGYESPTEIQFKTLPTLLEGKDLVAISQTGSGKTGGFLIPMLDKAKRADLEGKLFQTLIIAPTRELAFQIEKELHLFDMRRFGFWTQTCVGGTSMMDQIRNLRKTNQFIIGTPGRLVDLVKRGALNLSKINAIVLDEMDRMLEMGFIEDITWLVEQTPADHQSLYFSATLNSTIRPILKRFSPDAVYVELQQPEPSHFVDQDVVRIGRSESKLDVLVEILSREEVTKTLIFVNTKQAAEFVTDHLQQNDQRADYIHGGKTQSNRTRTLGQFKRMKEAVLVATDVAARGLDVTDITHVINFDEPQSYEDYIHRIGRTGRAGKYGVALTILNR
jgi:superfamily II DNA/RNA helicase